MDSYDVIVGFSTTNLLISKIIRKLTRSNVSHSWISYYDKTLNQRMVMQAELFGFEVIPFDRWIRKNTFVRAFVVENNNNALAQIASFIGEEYDVKSILRLAIKKIFGKVWRKPYKNPLKLMCSEAVLRFLQFTGEFPELDPEEIEPGELMRLLEEDGFGGIDVSSFK